MSGPKRNPDKLNTIGVVVVGVCGAVLVYVTIVALQAFYVEDTSEIQTMADYGGQDLQARNVRVSQTKNLNAPSSPNPRAGATPQTYRIPIKQAFKQVVDAVKADPQNIGNLIPVLGRSDRPTVAPAFGRPKPLQPAVVPDAAGSGSAAPATAPTAGSGSNSAAPTSASGSATSTPAPPPPAREVEQHHGEPTPPPPQTGSAAKGNAG